MTKNILIYALTFGLVLSIITNIYLLSGENIRIASPTTNHHVHNHQEQMQGQLSIYGNLIYGNVLDWQIKEFDTLQEYVSELLTNHISTSFFSKPMIRPIFPNDDCSDVTYKYIGLIPSYLKEVGKK